MPNVTTLFDAASVPEAKVAIHCPSRGTSYTYREVRGQMNRLAQGLLAVGVRRGDRVCIYLESSPEYLFSYFAIWRIGAVAVPTNRVYRGEELLHAITNAGAVAVITDPDGAAVVSSVRDRAGCLHQVICTEEGVAGTIPWQQFAGYPAAMRAVDCSFDHLCQLQYTSGTTGSPKGAMLTHGNWMSALDAEREALGLTPDDVYLGIYPMGHVGISWGLAALRAGGTFVIMERFHLDRYLALIERYQVTVLAGMPPVIHALVHSPEEIEAALSSVKVIISGGGSLLPSVWEAFDRRFHIPVANSYGLSETIVIGSGTTTLPNYPFLTRGFRSVGVPVGYTEVKIVSPDDPDEELPPDTPGEIALRGPSVAQGYWQMPEATAAVFLPGGWFLTGDIGYLDSEGILFITDRKKDMIIMSGWKVYPTEVENVLVQHPKIADVAVFGSPDERRGEIPIAVVVPAGDEPPTFEEISTFCRAHLAGYKVPRGLIVVDSLPRVNGWKLLRRTLREEYSNRL
jgi:long-chain acyl-CoA synthetase